MFCIADLPHTRPRTTHYFKNASNTLNACFSPRIGTLGLTASAHLAVILARSAADVADVAAEEEVEEEKGVVLGRKIEGEPARRRMSDWRAGVC